MTTMDTNALQALSRAELQKIAKVRVTSVVTLFEGQMLIGW